MPSRVHRHAVHGDTDVARAGGGNAGKRRVRLAVSANSGHDPRREINHIAADQRQVHDLLLRNRIAHGGRLRRQKLVGRHGHFHGLRDRAHLQGEVLPDLLGSPKCHLECLRLKTR